MRRRWELGAWCPQRVGECVESGLHDAVIGPAAALLAGDQPGVDQHLEMVGHGRLGESHWFDQVAHACFTTEMRGDQRQQPHTGRVAEGLEHKGQVLGRVVVEFPARDRAATGGEVIGKKLRGAGHGTSLPHILTFIDTSIIMNELKFVQMRGVTMTETDVRAQVRARYAQAAQAVTTASNRTLLEVVDANQCCAPSTLDEANASCCGGGGEVDAAFGASLYSADAQGELPAEAVAASLGCGNPMMVAELAAGETVLDLGSGGGIDVLLSARRVGPTGFAYGVDMTDEMLELARANAAKAGVTNIEFVKGIIEAVPLPDGAIDVVISNCVINLSTDKSAVFAEMFRLLTPGGRIGISDVVAEDDLTPAMRAERGTYVGCIAGALSRSEYLDGLAAVGFTDTDVTFTHEAAPGMHGAIIRAIKPED